MDRPLKPAPDQWWWPRLTPGFVVLSIALAGAFLLIQTYRLDFGTFFLLACFWLPMGLLFGHRVRLANRVLLRPGVTCPCCLRVLDEDSKKCTHCNAGHNRSVYVDYWTMVSTTPALAERWWRSMSKAEGEQGRTTYLTVTGRWQVGLLVSSIGLVFVGTVVLRPTALLGMDMLWMLPLYVGIGVGAWIRYTRGSRRAGDSLHCARCDYQIDPNRLSMAKCPECGSGLTERDETVVGRRIGHRGFTLLSTCIIILSVGLVFVPLIGGSFIDALSPSSYLPVSIYVDDALSGHSERKSWKVLMSRYAEPEDVRRLAESVVAHLGEGDEIEDIQWSFGMSEALAFQLDGPNVPEDLRFEVALALMQGQDEVRLYELRDWLAQYLRTILPGSSEYAELLAIAESSYIAGTIDYRITSWLETQRGERLQVYNDYGRFCRCALVMEVVQTDTGPTLVVRTNPDAALSPRHHPDEPVAIYLRVVEPGQGAPQVASTDARFFPLEHLGRSHTLATIPIDGTAEEAAEFRVHYVVYSGEDVMPASIVQWYDGRPITPNVWSYRDVYGPMELAPGWTLARDLQQSPRQHGTGNPAPIPPLPSRPR